MPIVASRSRNLLPILLWLLSSYPCLCCCSCRCSASHCSRRWMCMPLLPPLPLFSLVLPLLLLLWRFPRLSLLWPQTLLLLMLFLSLHWLTADLAAHAMKGAPATHERT